MKEIIIEEGQCLMDIAIQYYGSAESLVDLCNDNGLALGDSVASGTRLMIRKAMPISSNTLYMEYIYDNGVVVSSGSSAFEWAGVLATNMNQAIITNNQAAIEV
jgi:hypothetical protein